MRIVAITLLVVVIGAVLNGQVPVSHSDAERRLARMTGRWAIEEQYAGDPSRYVKTSSCEMFAGGPHLVCTSEADTPLGRSKGLSILSYNRTNGSFTNYTISSVGVAALVQGTVTDGAWVGDTSFPLNGEMVKARVTLTDESSSVWTYKMEGSIGGTRTFVLQEARATKVE